MPGHGIIIISGGGGSPRATMVAGVGYPVTAGEAIENTATTGPDAELTFVNNAMQLTDIFLPTGDKYSFTEDGAITLAP